VYPPNAPLCLRDWSRRHASIGRSSLCSARWQHFGLPSETSRRTLCRPHTTDWLLVDYQFQRRSLYCWIGQATAAATTVPERAGSRQNELGDSAGDNSSVVRAIHFTGVFVWRATWKAGNWWIAALVLFQSMPTRHGAPETIDCVFILSCRALRKNTTNDTTVHWPVRYSSTLKAVHLFAWDRNSLFSHQTTGNLSGCLSTKSFPIDSKLHHASDFLN